MALFDKPFRYVPGSDPADIPVRGDVAVVDAVVSEAPAPGTDATEGTAEGDAVAVDPSATVIESGAAEPGIPARPAEASVEPLVSSPAGEASVEPVEVSAVPTRASVEPAAAPAVPKEASVESVAIEMPVPRAVPTRGAPVSELVRGDEHELRTAADAPGLVVFSRVVPAAPASMPLDTQRLVTAIAESEPVLDQLRSLAASLHQARTGRELRVVAVTSSVSGEGKTLLAANLALTLSRSYMRQVLLIDADLRRPGLHRLFGTSSRDSVHSAMEAVREGTPVVVQEVAPRLSLLPAGHPVRDPISVLASDAMQRLIASANAAFDWVIVDTPPVGMLPDMSLLGSLSDAVLLVVESGRVRYDLVQRTVETIGADRIFGVVLNKVPEQDIVASYGMHYYAPYR